MSTTTTHYSLVKPAVGENYDIGVHNTNYDTIDTTLYAKLDKVNAKWKITDEGGYAIKLTNKTGGASVKGYTVRVNSAVNNSVTKTIDTAPDCIGVMYETGVADGSETWIVISGIADVYFIGNTTAGHLARTFVAGEVGYVSGQALSESLPTTPFATDKHFCEIGHVLESRVGAGLAKTVLHFN